MLKNNKEITHKKMGNPKHKNYFILIYFENFKSLHLLNFLFFIIIYKFKLTLSLNYDRIRFFFQINQNGLNIYLSFFGNLF